MSGYHIQKFHIYAKIRTCEKTLLSLTFSFEGKLRNYDISVKRKYKKTNENVIFSVLFTRPKYFFSCSEYFTKFP